MSLKDVREGHSIASPTPNDHSMEYGDAKSGARQSANAIAILHDDQAAKDESTDRVANQRDHRSERRQP